MILYKDGEKAPCIYEQEKEGLKEPLKDKCFVVDEAKEGEEWDTKVPKETLREKTAGSNEPASVKTKPRGT